jgi:hypothetical protein
MHKLYKSRNVAPGNKMQSQISETRHAASVAGCRKRACGQTRSERARLQIEGLGGFGVYITSYC